MPLLKELSRTSRDSFESESDSKESRDVRLNSFKSGIFHFCHFWANYAERPGILSNQMTIRKNPGTIGLIPSKVTFRNFCSRRGRVMVMVGSAAPSPSPPPVTHVMANSKRTASEGMSCVPKEQRNDISFLHISLFFNMTLQL